MRTRPAPTARRIRLGTELRKLRERAELTATQGANLLGISQAQLSNIECSRFGVSPDRIRAMARNYRCSDTAHVEGLVELTQDHKAGWWETYRGVLPGALLNLAELDHYAYGIRAANSFHIPGLLQITDHTREIYRHAVPEFTPSEVEHRVSHRLQRQAIIAGDSPTPFSSLIHESALRIPVGGAAVARRQLQHLVQQSEYDHISIRVIPFAAGAHPGAGQSIYCLCGPIPQLDTVSLDQAHGPALVHAENQLHTYRVLLARMESFALTASKSRDFIHDLSRQP